MKLLNFSFSLSFFLALSSMALLSQAVFADTSSFHFKSNSGMPAKESGEIMKVAELNLIVSYRIFDRKEDAERFARKSKIEGFEVEISTDIEGDKTIYKVLSKKSLKTSSTLDIRQNQEFQTDQSIDSNSRRVTVQPPAILSPKDRAEFRGAFTVSFVWNTVYSATGYHFILARDELFSNIVRENTRLTATSYTAENLDYGIYFFKISAIASDGTEGPFSSTQTFVIAPPVPLGIIFP